MYLLYEEDGDIKAGTLLADNDSSLQIESQHGKRGKLKANHVLLRFGSPLPAEVMESARALKEDLDLDFLWEVAGGEEFGFETLAADYFGHAATPTEASAIVLALHNAPIYFQKKGKGRYKAAAADILAAAKAGLERRARETALRAEWVSMLVAGKLPEPFHGHVFELAHKPDKNGLEYKALNEACAATNLSPVRLLDKCGAIPSSHDFHRQAFRLEQFPKGFGFPELAAPLPPPTLPAGDTPAFSIDDAATTEIDDAFSVIFRPDGGARVGIHIAAPALGILPGSDLDRLAASRLSTVYSPAEKFTMLPEGLIAQYTLAENSECPALSLYLEVGPDYTIETVATVADRISIAANLRHETLEPLFNENSIGQPGPDYPFRRELEWLFAFARSLEIGRGKAEQVQRHDFVFRVTSAPGSEKPSEPPPEGAKSFLGRPGERLEDEQVEIKPRPRGNPIDKLVSELMILANNRWGEFLAEKNVAGIYRAQTGGKVRMTLSPAPHEGLGVSCYTWSTSPLRRYVDLVNQRQILAAAAGEIPPHTASDPLLFAAVRDFELAYDVYNDYQRRMERYWCLRWIQQEAVTELDATAWRENLVRLDGLPFVARITGAPTLNPGERIRVGLSDIDLLDIDLTCRYLAHLDT
ncbi:MAG: RNB domain-containing ribonuclease [Pseudomonadota bacterium]|nr:RNB domain-containing ribonuclease [Pseudomonadota bacterium]